MLCDIVINQIENKNVNLKKTNTLKDLLYHVSLLFASDLFLVMLKHSFVLQVS